MALIKCKECGKEISDKADSCPNCGIPLKKMKIGNTTKISSRMWGWLKRHKFTVVVIVIFLVMLLCVLIIDLRDVFVDDFQRKFTGEYKELVFCETGYELNEKNNKCIKIDSDTYAKTPDYEYVNPHEDWGVGWKLVSTTYSSPKKLYESILPLKEDFEHRYECYTFSEIDMEDNVEKSYRCYIEPETKETCPSGYVLINDFIDKDLCFLEDNVKDPILYNMPIYEESSWDLSKYGIMCNDGSLYDDEKEVCYEAKRRAVEATGDSSSECRSLAISDDRVVLVRCELKDINKIKKYETNILYVAAKKTDTKYDMELGNIISHDYYKTNVGLSPKAVKVFK